jgi:hypothetical protein
MRSGSTIPERSQIEGGGLKTHVLKQILESAQNQVWTASDFAALGSRAALDKVPQRLVATRELRRMDASYRLVRVSGTFAISPGLMEARTAKQAGTCGNSSCKAIDFVRKMTTAILRPARFCSYSKPRSTVSKTSKWQTRRRSEARHS